MPGRIGKGEASRPVTLQDIADRCKVSRFTVSCALRGDRGNVSQAVMDRIVGVAGQMGYDATLAHAARRLKYRHSPGQVRSHLVALFFPVFNERYWTLIFEGINRVLQAEHYGLLLCSADARQPRFRDTLPYVFRRGELDGILIFAGEDCGQLARALGEVPGVGERPIVTMAEQVPGFPAVVVDDRQIGGMVAGHLLDLGHRHLLCFHQPGYQSTIIRQRVEGHEQAMRDRGLDPAVHLHHGPWVWDDPRGLEAAVTEVLDACPKVTGLLCPNDAVGIRVARTLVRMGRRIPEDLSIMGVDDSEEWMPAEDRNIWTTVRLPLHDLGAESAGLLMKRIRGEASRDTVIRLPVSLVLRGTTCPPRVSCG